MRACGSPRKKLAALVRLSIEAQYRNARGSPPPADASHPLAKLAQLVPQRAHEPPRLVGTLWRCNVAAWNLWCAVQTMWHSDGGMRTGLRVADVHAFFEVGAVELGERKELFELLQECEREALEVYAEQREIEERERQRKAPR